jgi:hypothetical protein
VVAHSFHGDILLYGLDDSCPRCEQHTEHPEWSLDAPNLNRLLEGHIYTELDRLAAERLKERT